MPVSELKDWLAGALAEREESAVGRPIFAAAGTKSGHTQAQGGVRTLGVPTVVDRLIQQALHQALQPLFEPEFSDHSYGFRPGRGAHQAVRRAQAYIREGKRWVVDIDLEKFFDRVNHDVLMARVARGVSDARVLKLIRRFLEAGMMRAGVVEGRTEGTPQGGPLSPLLSNILLNDLDRELERRSLAFCRYADDCNIYVGSRAAGERVMSGIRVFLEDTLHLRVNAHKSAVARPWERKFLGFSVTAQRESRLRIAKQSVQRLRQRVRELLRAGRGQSLRHTIEKLNPLLRGWINYFQLTQSWRCVGGTGWLAAAAAALCVVAAVETPVHSGAQTTCPGTGGGSCTVEHRERSRALVERGSVASQLALPAAYFTSMGLVSLLREQQRLQCVR